MKVAKLKNGSEEAEPLVCVVLSSLELLIQSDPIAFYELVMLARDSSHELFGNAADKLRPLALIENGDTPTIHQSTRNVIISAVEGDGLEMCIVSPFAETATPASD